MTRSPVLTPRPFPYRANSLNLFRLILAALVLFAHGFYIVGRPDSPGFNGENLGGWAVIGFFVISGFLITRSRLRTDPGTYLLHRVARIMPAFIVCLVVTALVFGPIAQMLAFGSLSGYATNAPTPAQYVWGNLALQIKNYAIGNSLATVPYPDAWNGSLWTLSLEFICYLLVWVFGFFAIFRKSIVLVAAMWVASVALRAATLVGITAGLDEQFVLLTRLFPYFMGGALLYFVIDRYGLRPVIGWISIPVAAVLMAWVPGLGGPIAAPVIGYALLHLSTLIPQPAWIARNDVSYGFYIYAWPIQQLVVLLGGAQWGIPVYTLVCAALTFALATASWFWVERPVMSATRRLTPQRASPRTPAPAQDGARDRVD